jgi:phosphoglycolate phosphatase
MSHSSPAFVFDLDGTLVDTAPDLLDALNWLLAGLGRRAMTLAEVGYLVGHGARAMLAEALRRTGEPVAEDKLNGLFIEYIDRYRAHVADKSLPYAGVETTLRTLSDNGARLGVLTNKPQELAEPLLAKLDLAQYFRTIHGAGRFSYTKPDARVFHHVLEELGGAGAGAAMIGDSATDVATARAAGVPVVLLSYGYTTAPARTLGADIVIDDFTQLPGVLEQLLSAREAE